MKRSNSIKFVFLVVVGIAFMGCQQEGFSQKTAGEFLVSGKVNNPQGEKAIGAVILVKGTTIGTATDTAGYFELKVPSDQAILVISHFSTSKSAEVALNGSSSIVVRLEVDTEMPSSMGVSVEVNQVFDRVEVMPRPKEGENGWDIFMSNNAKYPANDRASGVEGTVVVSFVVQEDGALQNIEILRGIGGECDEEVFRLVTEGPDWQPGMIGGKAVKTRMSLPIRFVLVKEQPSFSAKREFEKVIADQYGPHLTVVGYQSQPALRF